jgi:hypothetical protein
MTLHNAWTTKPVPLIKDEEFTFLTETEVAGMRSFVDAHDETIEDNEVFFYMPVSGGAKDIEGDDFLNHRLVSDATPSYPGARRTKVENLLSNGSSNPAAKVPVVMWKNATASPTVVQQVLLTDGLK